eukprot:NODE_59_length_28102_cov_0.971110.p20 type:complete len:169 gc:universal NODE_59_length_28102_cov_0.971110:70-576(+)
MDNTAVHTTTNFCDAATQCEILKVSWMRKLINSTKRQVRMIMKKKRVNNLNVVKEAQKEKSQAKNYNACNSTLPTIPEFPEGLLEVKLVTPVCKLAPPTITKCHNVKQPDRLINEIKNFQASKLKSVKLLNSYANRHAELDVLKRKLQTIRNRSCTTNSSASESSDWI